MTIFTIFLMVMMVMLGGIGVDLMRSEMIRTTCQNTLDRAILAAADLDQTLDPESVVTDYYAKSQMNCSTPEVTVDSGLNYRTITALSSAEMPTTYMKYLGNNDLPIYAGGVASEWVPNIEISLVLDISGSMRFNEKMDKLRPAASGFVGTVLQGQLSQYTSINLVPYAGQTTPGPFMFNRLKGQRYSETVLSQSKGGVPSIFAHPAGTTFDDQWEDALNEVGDEDGDGEITTRDVELDDDLKDTVTYVYPNDTSCLELTSSDFTKSRLPNGSSYEQVGHFMNWAIAADVMDWGWCPNDRSSVRYAQNSIGQLTNFINNMRMHDGTGTAYAMKYALALLDPQSKSDFQALANEGLMPSQFVGRPAQWDDPATAKYIVLMTDGQITEQIRPKTKMHEDNPTRELAKQGGSRKTQISSKSTNVDRFEALCALAKSDSRNVIIYTIAFSAPTSAQNQMRKCASSDSHYYAASPENISEVFQSIARQVRQLRLVY